jgi:hypothetical protein
MLNVEETLVKEYPSENSNKEVEERQKNDLELLYETIGLHLYYPEENDPTGSEVLPENEDVYNLLHNFTKRSDGTEKHTYLETLDEKDIHLIREHILHIFAFVPELELEIIEDIKLLTMEIFIRSSNNKNKSDE